MEIDNKEGGVASWVMWSTHNPWVEKRNVHDTSVTRGTGETVEGGVDGLYGLRLDAWGKYEKWCFNFSS